jgi:hypothetical protein
MRPRGMHGVYVTVEIQHADSMGTKLLAAEDSYRELRSIGLTDWWFNFERIRVVVTPNRQKTHSVNNNDPAVEYLHQTQDA